MKNDPQVGQRSESSGHDVRARHLVRRTFHDLPCRLLARFRAPRSHSGPRAARLDQRRPILVARLAAALTVQGGYAPKRT